MKCWTKQKRTTARQKKAKEKALKWTSQTGKEPYKNHSEKNRALQNTKKNNKTTKSRRRVLRRIAKSSKNQHSENTDKWHLCKAGSFHMVNYRGPLPLKELHSAGETIVQRDPGGSWACLPPVYDYVWNHTATCCNICRTCPKKQLRKKKSPTKCWKEEVSSRYFLHSFNHTGSPQDKSYIHSYFIPGQNNKSCNPPTHPNLFLFLKSSPQF